MVEFGGNVILPGQDDWFIPASEELFLTNTAAAGPDAFVFSAALDGEYYSRSENYSRFYRYDRGRWLCVEIQASIAGLVVTSQDDTPGQTLVALSADGEVWFVADDTRHEQIAGSEVTVVGSLWRMRLTAGTLFALGFGARCFRRQGTSWLRDDDGIRGFDAPIPRKRPGDIGRQTDVKDIATLANGDQYLCGSIATARPALFWRSRGIGRWQWLGYAVDDPAYDQMVPRRILVEPPDQVWMTTSKGVLVKGNAAQGFRIATDVAIAHEDRGSERHAWFSNAVHYKGSIIVGSNVGPFRLRADGGWEEFAPKPARKPGEYAFANGGLEVSGDVIWAFGVRSVARFDGQQWEDVPIPPLYRPQTP